MCHVAQLKSKINKMQDPGRETRTAGGRGLTWVWLSLRNVLAQAKLKEETSMDEKRGRGLHLGRVFWSES